jgi:hypothetical protein
MSIDPQAPSPQTPEARMAQEIAALKRRVAALERLLKAPTA